MAAYTPSFLFDFTFLYTFTGFNQTQLLFIAMAVFLTELYFHITLSKRHLLYSFPLTLFLLAGIGLRVATSPISLSYLVHYLLFSLLLVVLIVDHRLYLFVPAEYKTPLGKAKMEIQKVSLPSFSSVHPSISTSSQKRLSGVFSSLSQTLQSFKQTMSLKIGIGAPQPAPTAQTGQHMLASHDEPVEDKPFVHPIEKQADKIPTTKQLLANLKSQCLDHLDSKINTTRLEEHSFLDSFLSTPSFPGKKQVFLDATELSSILDSIEGSAIILSRGVVKAANEEFSELIQRPIGDIIDKDFIHFLAPEGFSDFKSHCSERLAGSCSESFQAILLTKKHEKISMQATVKQTRIQGEQIEITIFQKINN